MNTDETTKPPPNFTGLWMGKYYYKGVRWCGPSNKIGHVRPGRPKNMPKFRMTDDGLTFNDWTKNWTEIGQRTGS